MTDPTPHPSALKLDALKLNLLSDVDAQALRSHLSACAACQRQVAFSAKTQEAFLGGGYARVQARGAARPRPWSLRLLPFVGIPALLLGALLVVGRWHSAVPEPDFRVKGSAAFQVYAKHEGHVFQLKNGDSLAPGDGIRFVVEPGAFRYLLIVSVDGEGKDTVYFPYGGARSAALPAEARTELPGGITLDAALGPERLFALFSAEPIEVARLQPSLEALRKEGAQALVAAEGLPYPAFQRSVLFQKAAP